jgi:hypothetical protein
MTTTTADRDRERERSQEDVRRMALLLRDARTRFYGRLDPLDWLRLDSRHARLVDALHNWAIRPRHAVRTAPRKMPTSSRGWFLSNLTINLTTPFCKEKTKAPTPTLEVARWPDGNGRCARCADRFQEVCNDDEVWVYVNAERHVDGRVYHPECIK